MRQTTTQTQDAWLSGEYVGEQRPMVRATIQRLSVCLRSYGNQTYSSIPFGQASTPVELPNVKSVKWNRSVNQGTATCTLVLYNTEPLPLGQPPVSDYELDQPGYYTYQRGGAFYSPRWNHAENGWQDWIVPDRIIRTYEGYGFDATSIPEEDPHLYQSGTWLIDDVDIDHEGFITVECRDIGRALLDQVLMPPIVPTASYPLYFEKYWQKANPDVVVTTGTGWTRPTYDSNSNVPYVGQGDVHGHVGPDAFDTSTSSYWLSVGNAAPDDEYSFEWVQGKFSARTLAAVRVRTWGGPYLCFVSVYANGAWQGKQTVPYNPNNPISAPNGANIRYLYSFTADREDVATFALPKPVVGATKVRVTFTNLTNSGIGPYRYRAGVRTLEVSSEISKTVDGGTHQEPKTSPPGYADYTDIVKILLAYAGWHWPNDSKAAFYTRVGGSRTLLMPPSNDPVLRSGRVWGDFELTGTAGVAALGVDIWDKKPVMDGINYVKDLVGFIFFIDEEGGAVFRSPNIWSVGNWVGNGSAAAGRTTDVVEIDETKTLMSLGAKLSSRSIRERIFVGNLAGQVAGMSRGLNPYPSGLRRVGGWTDSHFQTAKECKIMADLIALRQLFTYRTDKVKVPGNPAIQIDDQVRIYERITEEGYLHYVESISMNWDVETGRYTYDLGTHWLGDTAFSNWTFNPDTDLSAETLAYLKSIGKVPA